MSQSSKSPSFSSRIAFLMAAVSSAIGYANICRFPSEASKYGGAVFLMVYLFFVFILGYPFFLSMLALGRAHQGGPYAVFRQYPRWQWMGSFVPGITFFMYTYYNVLIGWFLYYISTIISGQLLASANYELLFIGMQRNIGANIVATTIVFLVVALINQAGLLKGIERATQIMMPLFFTLLLILVLYALSLPSAGPGLSYYLKPEWHSFKVNYRSALFSALGHSFMSLSIGAGQVMTYGGYVNRRENLSYSAIFVVIGDTLVAFMAGLFVFPFLFAKNMGHSEGEAIAFQAIPALLSSLGSFWGSIVGVLFFTLLTLACITSAISILEVPTNYMVERFGASRKKSVWGISIFAYLIAILCIAAKAGAPYLSGWPIGKNLMYFLEETTINVALPFSVFCSAIFILYTWGKNRFLKAVAGEQRMHPWMATYLVWTVCYVAPLLIGLVLVSNLIGAIF